MEYPTNTEAAGTALAGPIGEAFRERFGESHLLVRSPGRVNLIGEHTDYNGGFVLPGAIDKAIWLAMAPNSGGMIRLLATDMDPDSGYYEVAADAELLKSGLRWPDYILGVVSELRKAGHRVGGFDCAFGGDIPIGAGLSSSAALEGGVVIGLAELFGFELSNREKALTGQRAENRFVGVNCGIMDQFANLNGRRDHLIKLDCRSLDFELYPFSQEETMILLCDTNVRRELAGSEYNVRRRQCEEGVEVIRRRHPAVQSLRDVSFDVLEEHRNELDEVVYRRCRYVLEENKRVEEACADLQRGDLAAFGRRMYQSHYGLRDDYEVSCRELDILVGATESLGDVLGSRMMGGGFGGCTINLVKRTGLEQVVEHLRGAYRDATGREPGIHVATIADGAGIVRTAG